MDTVARAVLAASRFRAEVGDPGNPRRLNFYGHFRRKEAAKKWHRSYIDHPAALREDLRRS